LAEVFREYHWPGNVRELENTVRRFLILRDAESLEREFRAKLSRPSVNGTTAPVAAREEAPASPKAPVIPVIPDLTNFPDPSIPVLQQVAKAKREAERVAILEALKTTRWNRRQAAVLLHVDYKALLYKMKGLSIKKEKPSATPLRPEIASVPALTDLTGASAERYSFDRARIGSRPPATNAPHSEGGHAGSAGFGVIEAPADAGICAAGAQRQIIFASPLTRTQWQNQETRRVDDSLHVVLQPLLTPPIFKRPAPAFFQAGEVHNKEAASRSRLRTI
jgi:hypothetical protein